MGEGSPIEWTDDTYNPWWGCVKVSSACTHCYAETTAARWGFEWGAGSAPREFGDKHWNEPLAWNRPAELPIGLAIAAHAARAFGATVRYRRDDDGAGRFLVALPSRPV